jgi:hypothetical protein
MAGLAISPVSIARGVACAIEQPADVDIGSIGHTTNGPGQRAGLARFVAPSTTALLQDFVGWKADVSVTAVARMASDAM